MADGSLKRIADVKKGDYVSTGFPDEVGTGLVTEVLTHEVGREVPVVILSTDLGDLIGTPDHPIYFSHQWIELSEALVFPNINGEGDDNESSMIAFDGHLEMKHVDFFHNLEVDGHLPGLSSHAYVVNGVIASGLGDNDTLNSLFKRQEAWKNE